LKFATALSPTASNPVILNVAVVSLVTSISPAPPSSDVIFGVTPVSFKNFTLKFVSLGLAVAPPLIIKFIALIDAYPIPSVSTATNTINTIYNVFLFCELCIVFTLLFLLYELIIPPPRCKIQRKKQYRLFL